MSDRLYATYKLKEANLGLQIIFQILTWVWGFPWVFPWVWVLDGYEDCDVEIFESI